MPLLLLLVYVVVGGALSGLQLTPDSRRIWPAILRYPVFVVPAWLVLALAVVTVLLVVPLVVTTAARRSQGLVGLARFTVGAAIADGFFAFAFPVADGPIPRPGGHGDALGAHWIGVPIEVVCLVVLFVRIVQTNAENTRLMRAGELDEGRR